MAKHRLRTIEDVRKYLANLINRLEADCGGMVDGALAGRLGYLSNIILGAIKDSDLEVRIRRLEDQFGGKS